MPTVTVSPKYQVVIPKNIRESLQLSPGQKIQVLEYGDRIERIPERSIRDMWGFLQGMDTRVDREGDRL